MRGYVWFGKLLMPTFAVFGFIFVGVLIGEIVILVPHLLVGASVQESLWLLIVVTAVSAAIFLFEALRFRSRLALGKTSRLPELERPLGC